MLVKLITSFTALFVTVALVTLGSCQTVKAPARSAEKK